MAAYICILSLHAAAIIRASVESGVSAAWGLLLDRNGLGLLSGEVCPTSKKITHCNSLVSPARPRMHA